MAIVSNTFKAITLSYKSTPLEVRELVSLNEQECQRYLQAVKDFTSATDVLALSTCNRTEVYYSSHEDLSEDLIKLLGVQKGIDGMSQYKKYFEVIDNASEAVKHLFRVSIGLESQVLGDLQIINQAKNAYQWSADQDVANPLLHRLMHTIFFTNKRVVQETAFRDGAASVAYATAEMVEEFTSNLREPKILILGLGEMGADVCRNLSQLENVKIAVSNRTKTKAEALGSELNLDVVDFENYKEAIKDYNVIVSGVSAQEPIITKDLFDNNDSLSYKYLIDMSVPRSIDQGVEDLPGFVLYNIDDIQNRTEATVNKRRQAIGRVEEIIDESLVEFLSWSQEMEVSPTIQKLKGALEQIRLEEIDRYVRKMGPMESEHVDAITKNIMQKIMKLPVLQLKAACKRGEAETLIDVLNDLFNLEKQEVSENN